MLLDTRLAVLAAAALALTASAATHTIYTDRADFLDAITVAHQEDFEDFFGSGAGPWAAVNFGPSTSAFFFPIEIFAENDGDVSLFGPAYHEGDGAIAVIDGPAATARISFNGQHTAVGLDLGRANFSSQPAAYRAQLLREGQPVTDPITAPVNTFLGVISDHPADTLTLSATTDAGQPAREAFDNIVLGAMAPACNPADLAAPLGTLDLADITTFIDAFINNEPPADLAPPQGLYDLADLTAFTAAFLNGCP